MWHFQVMMASLGICSSLSAIDDSQAFSLLLSKSVHLLHSTVYSTQFRLTNLQLLRNWKLLANALETWPTTIEQKITIAQ